METSNAIASKAHEQPQQKHNLIEANVMNVSAKFQLHPPYGSEDFFSFLFSRKFKFSVAMTTNQSQRFRHNLYVW